MNYSLSRIFNVTCNYLVRNLFEEENNDSSKKDLIIIDLTESKIGRILNDTPEENIVSILGNDFFEKSVSNFHTVEELLKSNENLILTDKGYILSNFKYFWGIHNGKLIAGELNELPQNMQCMPIRNVKHNEGPIIRSFINDKYELCFLDNNGNILKLMDSFKTIKTLLIGEKRQFLIVTNRMYDNEKISCKINELLLNNPCYLVWIDNGRYRSFQLEEINKKKFINNGFTEYDDMFMFGEVK